METIRDQEATRHVTENAAGERLIVVEWVKVITSHQISGSPSEHKSTRHWTLLDGSGVNYIDDDTFQVVQTDDVLRKV
jgi:hypothetical protein